jgi:hypothetical protein
MTFFPPALIHEASPPLPLPPAIINNSVAMNTQAVLGLGRWVWGQGGREENNTPSKQAMTRGN